MRYRGGVFDKVETWFGETPAARTALPWASGLALLLGLFVVVKSLSGGGGAPEPTPGPPAVTANLEKALAAAQVYFGDQVPPTFEGFNPKTAEGTDSTFTWNKSDTSVDGQVSIRAATKNNVLLVSKDSSATYCIYGNAKGDVSMGKVDATKSAECIGGW